MGLNTNLEAAAVGFGTTRLSANPALADTTLLTALGLTAFPAGVTGCDLVVLTGTLYVENDGTAADATVDQIGVGDRYRIRNGLALMNELHIATAGAYDVRVVLWG
jgi:hypothetical protein